MTSGWGRWGADDEAGALNLLDADTVLDGLRVARHGTVFSLAQPLGPNTVMPAHRQSPARFMDRDAGDYAVGAKSPGGFRFAEDTVLLPTHSGTHLDALAHAWTGDELYNGHPAASIRSTRGAQRCGADKLRPVVTRGILVDVTGGGDSPQAAGATIDEPALRDACARGGVEPRRGDAVLLRTGWWEHYGSSQAAYFSGEPGLTVDAATWLAARDVCLVGADNFAVEVLPNPDGAVFPVHIFLLRDHGIPLLENLDLAALAATGVGEFLFTAAPLPLAGSSGSPVAPLAIL